MKPSLYKANIVSKEFVKCGPGHYDRIKELVGDSKVYVYRNLRSGLWSIRVNGIVVCHTDYIVLKGVEFKVGKAGRQKVLDTRQKNVHAFVTGHVTRAELPAWTWTAPQREARYNPYKYASFVDSDEKPVASAKYADMMVIDGRPEPILFWD
jgi:hypothetical protein